MKENNLVVKAFQQLLQLTAEPLYVGCDNAIQQNIAPPGEIHSPTKKQKHIYPTIYSALATADPSANIKISTGLYTETLEIKIAGLKLQTNEPTSNVVIANERYPSMIIDLPSREDKICLQGIKFAHLCQYQKGLIRWPALAEIRDSHYRQMEVGDNMNTNILVKRGTLQIDQCRLSLAGQKQGHRLFGSIIVQEEGTLIMNRSEIIGGQGSIGIYCNGGKVNIRQCSIKQHGGIGILMSGGKDSSLVIKNSTISGCGEGLVLNGPFCSSIENNVISDCSNNGITTLFGNTSNIINNEIHHCKNGIEIENSLPKVMKNNLISNRQFGLEIASRMNGDCRPLIRFNLVSENKKGGILILGPRCRSDLCNNVITLNQKIGIKVTINAHPHIFLNEISNNFGNGVYLCKGGTGFLQKNSISGSLNCNLILQGPNNIDNYVYSNKIFNARGQGILLMHCEKFLIAKNNIYNNYNGVLAVTSVVNLEDNRINHNKRNGVMLIDDCQILMSENNVEGNKLAGFVCRKTSKAKMRMNSFAKNKIQVLIENGWEGVQDLQLDNNFDGEVRIPGNLTCTLI